MNLSAEQALIDRILSYDGCFDGYPSMTCYDENLIFAAVKESNAAVESDPSDCIIYLAALCADISKTREQYEKALSFYTDFCATVWECNMTEGGNEFYCEED